MKLEQFSITGEAVVDEAGQPDEHGDLAILQEADPTRGLQRYNEEGHSASLTVRLNEELLQIARDLTISVFELAPPDEAATENEAVRKDSKDWIKTGLEFYWELPRILNKFGAHACYLADKFEPGSKRKYYFVSEDTARLHELAEKLAFEKGFVVRMRSEPLDAIGPEFLPIEMLSKLALRIDNTAKTVRVGFGFFGHEDSLGRLREALEAKGYSFEKFVPYLRELNMSKDVSIRPDQFLETLRELVSISRSLGCSYHGEETVAGRQQFLLTSPNPDHYYPPKKSFISRLLGS